MYYEILVIGTNLNSHYEGRFFIKSNNKISAVNNVKNFLEVNNSNEFKFYIRQLNKESYLQNIKNANEKKLVSNKLLRNFCDLDICNMPFDKVTSSPVYPELIDLRYFN